MFSKSGQKKRETKKRIYRIAMQLFKEQGYTETTIHQITQEAGIAKGTLFNHYESKEAILRDFYEKRMERVKNLLVKQLDPTLSTNQQLLRLFLTLADFEERETDEFLLVAKDILQISFREMVLEQHNFFLKEILKEVLQQASKKEELVQLHQVEQIIQVLISMYVILLFEWLEGNVSSCLSQELYQRLIIILDGISQKRGDYKMEKVSQAYDVVVVGGGLAGLSSAAYLAKHGKKVLLLERGVLGGRAVTLKLKGFSFNFGAHAIYGRDTSVLRQFEKEIGIKIEWKDFEPHKAKYDLGDDLTDVPANVSGLFRTKVIKGRDKLKFTFEIFKTLIRAEKGHPHKTIKKWMEEQGISKDVGEMMLILASSNFFTNEPEKIRSDVFFDYYSRLFSTNKPVAYIGGGWQALIDEFVRVIEENDGTIMTKAKVERVSVEDDRIVQVHTSKQSFSADDFIFCIAPKELAKIVQDTKIVHSINQYASYEPSYVFVYDVGLSKRIDVPYSYVYDKQHKMFITDISYYDENCVPPGGQLLQAIAYMRKEEVGDKEITDKYQTQIESLYDKHFSGWRDNLVVPRISKRAIAQEIKWVIQQNPMPTYFPDYRNLFFAGDWCKGKGQLSELSFSSALACCQVILKK